MTRLLVLLALVVSLAGCSGGVSDEGIAATAGATKEPRNVVALKAMAQEQADRYSSGDYGGAWDMWSKESKAAISRADYVTLITTCYKSGVPLTVSSVRIDSSGMATIRLAFGGFQRAYHPSYEDGHWVWNPTDEGLAQYSGGVDKAIRDLKASGDC
jgi:hypothetical protein